MDDHLSIFDDLYDIKDDITDGKFLILNNKIKSLIQENKNLKKKLSKKGKIVDYVPEINQEAPVIIHEIELVIQQQICSCSTRWIFPDSYRVTDNLTSCFCLESLEKMQNCENFKKLMEKLPLLENIFHKIDLPFVEEGIYQEYVKQDYTMICKILLFLVEKIFNKRNKIIITLVMYDFIIKNANFLKDYQRYAIATSNKFEELLTDSDFISIALEYSINCAKWLDIMKSTISHE